jgi:NADPH:quinone reductase-like Zn-dependent oxidoreductase
MSGAVATSSSCSSSSLRRSRLTACCCGSRPPRLNPVDYKVREGKLADKFPHHFPLIMGWDASGIVEAVGPGVTWFKPGDKVYGYCRRHELEYGTYADYVTVPEGYLAHMPDRLELRAGGGAAARSG